MTVIFANMGDDDCRVLQEMWQGLAVDTFIEINKDSVDWEDSVDEAIAAETDTLIMAGHGTSQGLLFPDFNRGEYIIHMGNVHLIKAKNVICSWCHASSFCANHNLHSFSTSMFISNVNEAYDNYIYDYSQEQINRSCSRFQQNVNELLQNKVPLDQWVMILGAKLDVDDYVDVFNRHGLFYL